MVWSLSVWPQWSSKWYNKWNVKVIKFGKDNYFGNFRLLNLFEKGLNWKLCKSFISVSTCLDNTSGHRHPHQCEYSIKVSLTYTNIYIHLKVQKLKNKYSIYTTTRDKSKNQYCYMHLSLEIT